MTGRISPAGRVSRRHMGVDGPPGSSRALRLDPYALPARYAARDSRRGRANSSDRTRPRARRAPPRGAGIPMKVGVPVHEFRGVSMRTLPPEGEEPAAVAVMLEHRDSALTVPLFVADRRRRRSGGMEMLGRVLGVPLLVVDSDGSLREPFRRHRPRRRRPPVATPAAARHPQAAPALDPDAAKARPAARPSRPSTAASAKSSPGPKPWLIDQTIDLRSAGCSSRWAC